MKSIRLEPHLSTEELERHARQAPTRGAFQRFQALYLIQAQHLSAPVVAKALQVSTAAIHQWAHLYNHGGVEGIMLKGRGGRRRAYLTLEEEAALLEDLRARAGEGLLITAKAVRERAQAHLGHPVSEDYAYDVLHRHGWRKIAPRSAHPESDPEEQEAFKKSFPIWSRPRRRPSRRMTSVP
ncbi:MAG TPA: winged helix-turn-helix domain-containing protein [Terriglobales bacterium]|nr:winged helix-turn-helix domain-containing protein [Terriglobales bacterium]